MSFPTGQSRKNRYQPHRSTKQFRLPLELEACFRPQIACRKYSLFAI